MNNKGFMMAEVVVVASIVLTFMAGLYLSYNKLYSTYLARISYYDAVGLYQLAYIRDDLIEASTSDTTGLNAKLTDAKTSSNKYTEILGYTSEEDDYKIFLIYNNKSNLNIIPGSIHETYKDYLTYLGTNADLTNTNYVMTLERCEKTDQDNCKYAYLEVQDGYE